MTINEFEKLIEPCRTVYNKGLQAKVKLPNGKDYIISVIDSKIDELPISEKELKKQLINEAIELGVITL